MAGPWSGALFGFVVGLIIACLPAQDGKA